MDLRDTFIHPDMVSPPFEHNLFPIPPSSSLALP